MMVASEFSRAESLSNNGGGKELKNCLLRAKELFGVLETDASIPVATARKLLPLTKELLTPLKANPGSLYNKAMRLAS